MTDSKDVFYGTLPAFPPILGVKGSQGSLHCLEITFTPPEQGFSPLLAGHRKNQTYCARMLDLSLIFNTVL